MITATSVLSASGVLLLSSLLLLLVFVLSGSGTSRNKHPPGPWKIPLLGNLFNLPKGFSPRDYALWKSKYGPVSYFRFFNQQFVLLNDAHDANELFEKRSAVYSSRPHLVMAGTLCGREKSPLFLPYGKRFKDTRRLMQNFMNAKTGREHWRVQEEETTKFLHRLLHSPEKFKEHIKSLPAATILKLVYGIEVDYDNDRFLDLAEALSRITTHASEPGRWLVDSFPKLRYLPSWLPGANFKKWANQALSDCVEFTHAPYEFAKSRAVNDKDSTSFVASNLIDRYESEEILMYTAAGFYLGGTDTLVSLISLFFLMMIVQPDIQRRAQAEIDKQVGDDRIPDMTDHRSLPYIDCLMKELLRYNPPIPLVPHAPIKDDLYHGYIIPEGAWVMANLWTMTHDPYAYPNPHKFDPERFDPTHGQEQPDPKLLVFGFGRRICPGQFFADASSFLVISQVLWAFDICPEIDSKGTPIIPDVDFNFGHSSHPKSYNCRLIPRSTGRIAVLEASAANWDS